MRFSLSIPALIALTISAAHGAGVDWAVYGGGPEGNRYSTLTQIDRSNVARLQHVWTFNMESGGDPQTHPLAIDGTVYAYTPSLKVIALDGSSGKILWQFDSGVEGRGAQRGLTWWTNGKQKRLFASVMNYLYALDPKTGKLLPDFGENGRSDLRLGLGRDEMKSYVSLTTPGILYKDSIIVGFRTSESAPAPPGDIRAYDVRSGKLLWSFHSIPHPGEFGHETWPADAWITAGGANSWAGMALDEKRGIVYAPTGSAVNDFYGADRTGDNLFANSLIALDARTGKRLWHFQGMHHDVLDRDFPSPPLLITVKRNGRSIDAVAQATKQGYLFVLDRVTGVPLFPVQEEALAQSDVAGEVTSATQPVSSVPAPFTRQRLTEDMLTNRTPEAHAWAVAQFRSFNNGGPFAPLKVGQQTIVFPGFDGGAEWGGAAADPRNGTIYINANDIAWTGGLAESIAPRGAGATVYQNSCSSCHGPDRGGNPPAFPALRGVGDRLTPSQIADTIHGGRGRMPAFDIQGDTLGALITYLTAGREEERSDALLSSQTAQAKYKFTGYRKFLDPDGYPAVTPPWGTLNAIDLNTGQYRWKIPLGEYPELAAKGVNNTGSENYGGPILTASGLLFISATVYDKKIRAFDANTGTLLWQTKLPFAGNATPITYMAGGRQFILIQTDNARDRKAPQGAAYVAFALPQ